MKYQEKLDSIIENASKIGDTNYQKFESSGKIKAAKLAIRSYNTVLRAIVIKESAI